MRTTFTGRCRALGHAPARRGTRGKVASRSLIRNPALDHVAGRLPVSIRVVIAEDQAMVLGALSALLEIDRDIRVAAQARNGKEALQLTLQHKPDVLITDIEMPELSGLEVAAELKKRGSTSRIIILTTFARPGYLRRALQAGATGYLLKDSPAAALGDAVRRVHAGSRVIDPELATEAWTEEDPLTDRERQVLRLAGEGSTS